MDLSGKVAIVTGGRRGIGLAITRALQHEGVLVVDVAKSASGAGDLYIQCDLLESNQRRHLVARVMDRYQRLDILVNNAGEQFYAPTAAYSGTSLYRAFELMAAAPFDLMQQAAAVGCECMVNVLSTSAYQGARNISGYVAAKHALLGLTKCAAIEWAPTIRVNAIAPGLCDTEMTDHIQADRRQLLNSITPAGRFVIPDEVAGAVLHLCHNTGMYGQVITVDGGWMAKNAM